MLTPIEVTVTVVDIFMDQVTGVIESSVHLAVSLTLSVDVDTLSDTVDVVSVLSVLSLTMECRLGSAQSLTMQ